MGIKEMQVYAAASDLFWYKDNLKGFATTNGCAIDKCYFIDDGAQHMLHLSLAAVLAIVLQNESSKSVPIDDERQISRDRLPASVNSPSKATATVSPTTAASAIESADPTSTVEFSLGTSVATGDFDSTSGTSIWSTALGGRATFGNVRLSASIPYMRVRSNATIFTGIDSTPVVIAPGRGPKQTNSGLGDITLGASYTLPRPPGALEIEVAARVKLPSATRESRLSSGATDYSLGVQATRALGRIAPFVSVSYRFLGNPAGFDLRDGLAASGGASVILNRRTVLLGSYHYARGASRFVRDGHELFLGFSRALPGNRLRLTGFSTAGLSSGVAAASGGLAVSLAL